MKWSTRDLVTLAVFGALWGVAEIGLGSLLHALRVPFLGTVMTAIGMVIALTGYVFVPRRGAVMVIGLVAALLKAFSLGGVVLNPMIAIVVESLLAELGLVLAAGRPRRLGLMLAGVLALLWDFFHPFFTQGILAGQGIFTIYQRILQKGASLLGLNPQTVLLVLLVLIVLRVVVGISAGSLAWDLGRQLTRRLRGGAGLSRRRLLSEY